MHPILQSLCAHDAVTPVKAGEFETYLKAAPGTLTAIFITGDPDKKLETADVVVVLRELLSAYPDVLRVGLVTPEDQSAIMEKVASFAVPALIFFAGEERLETLPNIQDWSVYAEALPRLVAQATEEVAA